MRNGILGNQFKQLVNFLNGTIVLKHPKKKKEANKKETERVVDVIATFITKSIGQVDLGK